ncbi:MAG: hypothetical protein N2Z79_02255, partial [Candidatus Omnitrophica bacterium]|nr:hypothetical protein [Candidatus Omnitrophota bacterium]
KILEEKLNKSFAQLIEVKSGQIIFVDNLTHIPYTQKMYILPEIRAPTATGINLKYERELTKEEKQKAYEVDALITSTGKRYLVEYNHDKVKPDKPAINFHPYKSGLDKKQIPIDLEKLLKEGKINYPEFFRIQPISPKEEDKNKVFYTLRQSNSLLGEETVVELTGQTLIEKDEKGGIKYLVSFSPEVRLFFDWAKESWGYEIKPNKGVRIIENKDIQKLINEKRLFIVGKKGWYKNYKNRIENISRIWNMTPEEFTLRFGVGTSFDSKEGGLLVLGKQAEQAVFFVEYELNRTKVIEAVRNAQTLWRAYPEFGEVAIPKDERVSEIYTYIKHNPEDGALTVGKLLGTVEKIKEIKLSDNRQVDVLQRKDAKGSLERLFGVDKDTGEEILRYYPKKGFVLVKRPLGYVSINKHQPEREKSGWDRFRYAKDSYLPYGELLGYSVDAEIKGLFSKIPEQLKKTDSAARIYKFDRKQNKFAEKETQIFERSEYPIATIKPDPLTFGQNKVIHIQEYRSDAEKIKGKSTGSKTYAYNEKTKEVITDKPLGESKSVNTADILDITSRKEIEN